MARPDAIPFRGLGTIRTTLQTAGFRQVAIQAHDARGLPPPPSYPDFPGARKSSRVERGDLGRHHPAVVQPATPDRSCGNGLLGRPVSESRRLCHWDGGHEGGARRRRASMLPILLSTIIGFRSPCFRGHHVKSLTTLEVSPDS